MEDKEKLKMEDEQTKPTEAAVDSPKKKVLGYSVPFVVQIFICGMYTMMLKIWGCCRQILLIF